MNVFEFKEEIFSGRLSLVDYYRELIDRIEEKKDLNIYLDYSPEKIMERVDFLNEKLKREEKLGSLFGVAVSVKDNILVKGLKNTCGSKSLENYYPIYNATIVNRLLAEDAVIVGKVNMDIGREI